MGDDTGISWTNATWNPIVGCSLVSPGCTNCYAMGQAHRIQQMAKASGKTSHYENTTMLTVKGDPVWTGKVKKAPDHIFAAPLHWKKPRRIFVNSMSDLFHESVPDEWIDQVFSVMARSPQHTFQVLTKRSKRMREYMFSMRSLTMMDERTWPLSNVWLGVSAEDQTRADERIPDLLDTPAAVRFVSAEPLLGRIDFRDISPNGIQSIDALTGYSRNPDGDFGTKLDWIIVGGESGDGFRPMSIEAAEAVMRQCQSAGTKLHFKQDSGRLPGNRGRASEELWSYKEFPA